VPSETNLTPFETKVLRRRRGYFETKGKRDVEIESVSELMNLLQHG
jgi:hypothetical protein